MNLSKSGSPPASRSLSIWFRSFTICFMRAMSSGDMLAIWSYMSLKKVSVIAFFSISISSVNLCCASGSMNS